jgi:pilus assembly protein Flp/PilA
MTKIRNFFKDDSGATMVEYGLMVTGIAIAVIGGVTLMGQSLSALFLGLAPTIHL